MKFGIKVYSKKNIVMLVSLRFDYTYIVLPQFISIINASSKKLFLVSREYYKCFKEKNTLPTTPITLKSARVRSLNLC